jgi:hypothetical protein
MPPTEEKWSWVRNIPGAVVSELLARGGSAAGISDGTSNTAAANGGSPAGGGPPKRGKDLTDKDFPTDIKQRKRADEEAQRKAKERLETKPESKSKGPPKDPAEELIEEALGDPQKRLEALAKWKVPRYSEAYKNDTPEIQFLADLESGTSKAQEYFEYMRKAAEYAEKYGDITALQSVSKAAAGLKKITGKLSGGLGKAAKIIKTAKQVAEWVEAVDDFADASSRMDPADRNSVKRWVGSMQSLWNATAPFAEWLQNKAATGAIVEGSEAAASLSATMAIVGAQLYIGVKLLDAGIKAESAYFDRMDRMMKQIDNGGIAPQPPPRDPLPAMPADWMSREEMAQDAAVNGPKWEDSELKIKIRAAERAKREAHEEKIYEATQQFDAKLFPKVYITHRPQLRQQLLIALRKAGKKTQSFEGVDIKTADGRSPESRWWDCLMSDDTAQAPDTGDQSLTGGPFFDKQAGIYVYPTKARVSPGEAEQELSEFGHVSPPCPFLKQIHDAELQKYLAKAVPPEK